MGLNYAPVPTKFPLQDTIASVKEVAKQLPKDIADDLWGRVCGILSARLPKDNLRKDHQKALKELRSLDDEVILPADKQKQPELHPERAWLMGSQPDGASSLTQPARNFEYGS